MFSTFPEDARWNAERQAVEFGVERSANTAAWSGCRGAYSNAYCRNGPRPSAALRRTTSSGPGSRASPTGSCAGGSD
jgi:hypothetical protein